MRKLLICCLAIISISCTKQNSKQIEESIKSPRDSVSVQNISESVFVSSADETAQIGSKELIFPDVAENKVIRKRLYLKNTLSSDLSLDFSSLSAAISGTPYSLINNSCLAVLLPNKVCYFDLQMEYSSSLSYAPINFRLYGESTDFGLFSLLGNKQAPVAPNKNIQFTKIGQLSDINSDRSIRIYLKNNGDIVYNSSMTIPAEYQVVRSSCVGTLLSSRSCYVDLKIKDTLDPNIVGVNKSIDYDGSSFAITAGSGSSPESIACNSGFTNLSNVCTQTNQIRACIPQPSNSNSGYQESSDAAQSWSACLDYSCDNTFMNVGGSCVAINQSESCSISNGSGSRSSTDGGQSWSTCSLVSCNSQFYPDEGICTAYMQATGGLITYLDSSGLNSRATVPYTNGYTVHTFLSSGNFIVSAGNRNLQYLVVAGGGGGGSSGANYAGGGGAGGMSTGTTVSKIGVGTYSITVGAGGAAQVNGSNSSAFGIIMTGGGAGASGYYTTGNAGGSGGGGAPTNGPGGLGIAGQGNRGGYASSANAGGQDSGAGGGGGAGGIGADIANPGYRNSAGTGGAGLYNNLRTGLDQPYAAGGTGSGFYVGFNVFGIGGSVHGGFPNGVANTGSGGGGGRGGGGGAGGSGIVVIRYLSN